MEKIKNILEKLFKKTGAISFKYLVVFFLSSGALFSQGKVITWGGNDTGGNSSSVASSIDSGVIEIFSTDGAFAALKSDGSVVTWGNSVVGGNSTMVAFSLSSGVIEIFSNKGAFAALKSDGSVVT